MEQEFYTVGKVKDAHGLKGELYVLLFSGEAEWLDQLETVHLIPPLPSEGGAGQAPWVSQAGAGKPLSGGVKPAAAGNRHEAPSESLKQSVSLTLKSARPHKQGLIINTKELRNRNEAEALIGFLFQIPTEFLVSAPGESIYLYEVQGFEIRTEAQGVVGRVESFGTNGAQDLLIVATAKGEVEIPFVEAFVERIDYEGKVIHMNLPEGLLGVGESEGEEKGEDEDAL